MIPVADCGFVAFHLRSCTSARLPTAQVIRDLHVKRVSLSCDCCCTNECICIHEINHRLFLLYQEPLELAKD